MELKIRDIAELFQISEKTVYRWIKQQKIPCYRINHQYRFNRAEINEWILSNKIELSPRLLQLSIADRKTDLPGLIKSGGIYYNVPGTTRNQVLENAVNLLEIPTPVAKAEITSALLAREGMMSTAIGQGVAIPHPHHPLIADTKNASVSICFTQQPIDFGALDSQPVHTLFIVLTHSPKRHLEILAKLTYLCQQSEFQEILLQRAPHEQLMNFIEKMQLDWNNKEQL